MDELNKILACRSAEWVAFLHAEAMAKVIMYRVRDPAQDGRLDGCADGWTVGWMYG